MAETGAFVYVALWRINYEGDSLIGVFTSEQSAEVAAADPMYNDPSSVGVVERWPLDVAVAPGAGGPPTLESLAADG